MHVVEHVMRDEFAAGVVAIGVIRLEDAEAILDGEARRNDEKAAGEVLAAGATDRVANKQMAPVVPSSLHTLPPALCARKSP